MIWRCEPLSTPYYGPVVMLREGTTKNQSLNRMHIMEDECSKPAVVESLPKTNGSPTPAPAPCQNSLDGEKKSLENGSGDIPGEEQAGAPKAAQEEEDSAPNDREDDGKSSKQSEESGAKKGADEASSPPASPPPADEDDELRSGGGASKRVSSDSDSDAPGALKKLKPCERERGVAEFVEEAARAGPDELRRHADKLQQEIRALAALARAKEREWNNLIRLRKLKEEMFLRLQRRRQVMLLDAPDWESDDAKDRPPPIVLKGGQPLVVVPPSVKVPDSAKPGARPHRPILPKPAAVATPPAGNGQNPVIGEGRQGPILDVRSIIADYRSRHPETVPRRGRRLKSSPGPPDSLMSSARVSGGGGVLSMASLALGSGSQVRTASEMGDIGFLLEAAAARQDGSRPSSADSSRSGAPEAAAAAAGISFKDVLVQFAKLSQTEQTTGGGGKPAAPAPPPYPEVTLHPVLAPHSPPQQTPSSSLLHGILTKSSASARPTTFSPTLARLLTAPERMPSVANTTAGATFHGTASHVSISDLLSTSKTRNEITITPVAAQPVKAKEEVVLVEEEQEDSADRLVIDESGDADGGRSRAETEDDQGPEIAAEDVPECQGCHQRAAQFVCAGCANQWYCSRDCQVSAWDEHSEVCSG